MKKIILITIAIILVLAVCTVGALYIFTDIFDNIYKEQTQKHTQGVLLDKDTDEETVYSLEILKLEDIESDYIKGWIDRNKTKGEVDGKNVYYSLYDDDVNTPLEMYLFMPNAKEVMGDITMSNIRVKESGAAIILNIDTPKNIKRTKEGTDLILHIYVTGAPEKAEARTDRLIINGVTYTCPGSTFTKLK